MRRLRRFTAGFPVMLALAAAGGATYQMYADRRDLAATPAPGRLVDVGGHRLHLWCKGHGRPVVLMDAGLGHTSFAWNHVLDDAASFTEACAYDRAGQGYSDDGPRPRTSLQIATEMRDLLSNAGLDGPVVLAGQSFGGINVRLFASMFEERTAGLVLVDAPFEDDDNGQTPWFAAAVPVAGTLGVLRARGVSLGLDPEREPADVRDFQRATSFRASRFRSMYSEVTHLDDSAAQVRANRRRLSLPIVVLSRGRNQNPRSLASQQAQAALSPRGCQLTVAGSGHIINRDNPRMVAEAIRATIAAAQRRDGTPCDLLTA